MCILRESFYFMQRSTSGPPYPACMRFAAIYTMLYLVEGMIPPRVHNYIVSNSL